MMQRLVLALASGALLVAAAPIKMAPADDKPTLVGAAARAKNGPDPTTKPPVDVGSAEDPPAIATPAPAVSTSTTKQ